MKNNTKYDILYRCLQFSCLTYQASTRLTTSCGVCFSSESTSELHGDGDDGIAAVTAVIPIYRGNGVRLYDGHRGNSGDGDSSHGSTAVAVTELTVDALFMH